MLPVIFHPATQEEIKQSFDWYQEQSLGLGSEFIDELEESIASIRTLPSAWNKMGVGRSSPFCTQQISLFCYL